MASFKFRRCDPNRSVNQARSLPLTGAIIVQTDLPRDTSNLKRIREHLVVDPDFWWKSGLVQKQQVIVEKNDGSGLYAAFTIEQRQARSSDLEMTIGVPDGTNRFNSASLPYNNCIIHTHITSVGTRAAVSSSGGYLETLQDSSASQARYIAVAPHGGDIELYTDEMAERFYGLMTASGSRSCTYWHGQGFSNTDLQDAYDRWHITAVDINPISYPILLTITNRDFEYGISFHGQSSASIDVGGGATGSLITDIITAISGAVSGTYVVQAADNAEIDGNDGNNLTNRLCRTTQQTIQLEMGLTARQTHRDQIVDAVVGVFLDRT